MITPFSSAAQFATEKALTLSDATAETSAFQTFTVAGLSPNMTIVINPTTALPTNLGIGTVYCSAANTLKIQVINPTAGTITGTAVTFKILGL